MNDLTVDKNSRLKKLPHKVLAILYNNISMPSLLEWTWKLGSVTSHALSFIIYALISSCDDYPFLRSTDNDESIYTRIWTFLLPQILNEQPNAVSFSYPTKYKNHSIHLLSGWTRKKVFIKFAKAESRLQWWISMHTVHVHGR